MTLVSTAAKSSGSTGGAAVISDTTLGADTASFDITGIPGTYSQLQIILQLRGTAAASVVVAQCRFNNDSGANYDYQYTGSNGTAINTTQNGGTSTSIGDAPAATATAGYAATIEAIIANYAGATFNKASIARSAAPRDGTASGIFVEVVAGIWRTTGTAINRVTIFPSSGSWKAGSRCTIYGLT